jgi:CRP-like cAMP-binding protein
MILAMQSTQLAACNRLHDVEERLARWLLMSNDRIGTESMPLTQDFLEQMLGARRASVSVAAATLQKAGLIAYTRECHHPRQAKAQLVMLQDYSRPANGLAKRSAITSGV